MYYQTTVITIMIFKLLKFLITYRFKKIIVEFKMLIHDKNNTYLFKRYKTLMI